MNIQLKKSALSAAIAFTLVACGGSGGDVAGIGGSGYISSGSVTGFGSVFVNGVKFETDTATFDVDGASGTQDDLAIGMVVRVNGSINDDGISGTASSISFDDELQGPVTGPIIYDADVVTGSFFILGIKVVIDSSSTSFDVSGDISAPTFGFDTIAENNNVEISGFFDSNGVIQATRVELKNITFDANSIVEVKGTIADLSGTDFNLGNSNELSVKAFNAALEDLPNGELANGLLVEVKGTFDTTTKILTATKVEAEDNSADDTDEFELEGIITNYDSASTTFTINGISVDASKIGLELKPTTLILANDLHVEVEGAIINGVLIATEVESKGGDIKAHAMVDSVDLATNTFEVKPVPTQPTITVSVTTGTQLKDDVGTSDQFTLDSLNGTHFVEVSGYDNGSGGIIATEVKIKELSEVIVQGNATEATASSMTVLGVTFGTDGLTDFENESDVNLSITEITELINSISPTTPRLIKIKDNEFNTGGNDVGIADEIDIESP